MVSHNVISGKEQKVTNSKKQKARERLWQQKNFLCPTLYFTIHFLLLSFAFLATHHLPLVQSAQKLDIGADYRLRGLSITNPTYTSEEPLGGNNTIWQKYYSHRARVYLKGNVNPKIEIGTVLQAIGISGSTQTLIGRYPREDFTPFFENIYIKADEIYEWPVSMTFGRQPYVWGSGLLVSDDNLGFDGIRADVGPFWGFRGHIFHAKNADRVTGDYDRNFSLAGITYKWGIHNIRVGWISDRDKSGTAYSHLRAPTPVVSDEINRDFYNLNVDGRLEKGAFYNLDFAIQRGKAKVTGKNETSLSGSALTFDCGFDYIHPRYKRMILTFVFMQGSGDKADTLDEDERFFAPSSKRYDGLERAGVGEFFAASPSGFFNDHKPIVALLDSKGNVTSRHPFSTVFSGIRSYGFRGSINPWEPFIAGLEFYLYSADEVIPEKAPTKDQDKSMGRELAISTSYLYAKRIQFAIRWGHFWPNPIMGSILSTRLLFEVSGRF